MLHAPLTLLTYVVHVAELDAPEYLEDVAAGLVDAQSLGILLQLLQDRVVDVLEDQEQLSPTPKYLYQIDEVLMAQSLNVETEGRRDWELRSYIFSRRKYFRSKHKVKVRTYIVIATTGDCLAVQIAPLCTCE